MKWLKRLAVSGALLCCGVAIVFANYEELRQNALPSNLTLEKLMQVPVDLVKGRVRWSPPRSDIRIKTRGALQLEVSREYRSDRKEVSIFGPGWDWKHSEKFTREDFGNSYVARIKTLNGEYTAYKDIEVYPKRQNYSDDKWYFTLGALPATTWHEGGWNDPTRAMDPGWENKYSENYCWSDFRTRSNVYWSGWQFDDKLNDELNVVKLEANWMGHIEGGWLGNGWYQAYAILGPESRGWYTTYATGNDDHIFSLEYEVPAGYTLGDARAQPFIINNDQNYIGEGPRPRTWVYLVTMRVYYTFGDGWLVPEGASYALDEEGFGEDRVFKIVFKDKSSQEFDDNGDLTRKTDANGNELTFDRDGNGLLTHIRNEATGQVIEFTYYPGTERVQSTGNAEVGYCEYEYDADGYLTAYTDLESNRTEYVYVNREGSDAPGKVLSQIKHPENVEHHFSYYGEPEYSWEPDLSGKVRTYTNPVGTDYEFFYEEGSRLAYCEIAGQQTVGVLYNDLDDVIRKFVRNETFNTKELLFLSLFGEEKDEDPRYVYINKSHNVNRTIQGSRTNLFSYDAANNMTTRTDPLGNKWSYAYHPEFNAVTSITNARGVVTTVNEYDDSGNLTRSVDALGEATTYTYDEFGNMKVVTAANGHTTTFEYDPQHINRTNTIDAMGRAETYVHDVFGNVVKRTDREGHTFETTYNNYGMKVWEKDPVGTINEYFYDGSYRLVKQIMAAETSDAYTNWFGYDAMGRLTSQTNGLGHVTRYEYDVYGNKTAEISPLGHTRRWEYDEYDRLTREIDPLSNSVSYVYDSFGNVITTTNARGYVTHSQYDANDRLIVQKDPKGSVTEFTYDETGRKFEERLHIAGYLAGDDELYSMPVINRYIYDENDHVLEKIVGENWEESRHFLFEYDKLGRLVKSVNPEGNFETLIYDEVGNIATKTVYDENGDWVAQEDHEYDDRNLLVKNIAYVDQATTITNILSYDSRGLKIAETNPRQFTTHFFHDKLGQLVAVTNAAGEAVSYLYDKAQRKMEEVDARGLVTKLVYDEDDRLETLTLGFGSAQPRVYSYTYDAANQKIEEVDPLGEKQQFSYDKAGNVVQVIDQRGYATTFNYDPINQVVEVEDPLGYIETKRRDGRGLVWEQVDKRGYVTRSIYDPFGQLISVETPSGSTVQMEYDGNGRKVAQYDSVGLKSTWSYNALGNVVRHVVGEEEKTPIVTTRGYDALGRMLLESNALGHVTFYSYDGNGNVTSIENARSYVTSNEYDEVDRLISVIDHLGNDSRRIYDEKGDLVRDIDKNENPTHYQYNVFGEKTHIINASNQTFQLAYDDLGRLVKQTDPGTFFVETRYDENGNIVEQLDELRYSRKTEYDPLNRPTIVVDEESNVASMRYDANGNKIWEQGPGGQTQEFEYDVENRLIKHIRADLTETSVGYDERGNKILEVLPDDVNIHYTYDRFGRLVKQQKVDRIEAFEYDALGRIVAKTNPLGFTMRYAYDENGNKVVETNPRKYTTEYQYNELDRLVKVVDALDNTIETIYDAVGNILHVIDPRGNSTTNKYNEINQVVSRWDREGNRTDYEYDERGHLKKETLPDETVNEMEYDARGLLEERTIGAGLSESRVLRFSYDGLRRKVEQVHPDGSTSKHQYDARGNLVEVSTWSDDNSLLRTDSKTEYDDLNRPIKVTDAMSRVSQYEYDTMGRVTKQIKPDETSVQFTYNSYGEVIEQMDELEHVSKNVYDLAGRLIRTIDAESGSTIYQYDEVGNRTKTIDSKGNAWVTTYDALNRIETTQVPSQNPSLPPVYDVNNDGTVNDMDRQALEGLATPP